MKIMRKQVLECVFLVTRKLDFSFIIIIYYGFQSFGFQG